MTTETAMLVNYEFLFSKRWMWYLWIFQRQWLKRDPESIHQLIIMGYEFADFIPKVKIYWSSDRVKGPVLGRELLFLDLSTTLTKNTLLAMILWLSNHLLGHYSLCDFVHRRLKATISDTTSPIGEPILGKSCILQLEILQTAQRQFQSRWPICRVTSQRHRLHRLFVNC